MDDFLSRRIECGDYVSNSYLVYRPSREDALIIDPGDGFTTLMNKINASGKKLTHILLTHGHFDHMLAANKLRAETGAKIYVHPLDAPMLRDADLNMVGMIESPHTPFSAFDADEMLSEGTLRLCGLNIEVIPCPGHTPGGVSFYLPDQRVLYSGDTLFAVGFGRYDLPGGNVRHLYDSIRRLTALPGITLMCPGHGESVPLKEVAEEYQ